MFPLISIEFDPVTSIAIGCFIVSYFLVSKYVEFQHVEHLHESLNPKIHIIPDAYNADAYFKFHLVYNFKHPTEYCFKPRPKRQRQNFMEDFPLLTLQQSITVFQRRAASNNWQSIRNVNPPAPFTQIIVRDEPGMNTNRVPASEQSVPVVLRATIYGTPLPTTSNRRTVPQNIIRRKDAMNRIRDQHGVLLDEAGHLLAYSLRGEMTYWFNYVPQLTRLNRPINNETSAWYYEEEGMRQFLVNW